MFGLLMPKGVFRYAAMPEIGIRFHSLFMGGFNYIPFFIAVVYQMVGLLPRNHPYLVQSNMGMYGIRHVVFEAGRNIQFNLKNIDQIVLFIVVLLGLVIFLVQILSLGAFFFFQPALAGIPTNWAGFFTISNAGWRSQDLAFMMLDMVFGVPHPSLAVPGTPAGMGFFESCIGSATVCEGSFGAIANTDVSATAVTGAISAQFGPLSTNAYAIFPFPFHVGLHRLFSVYSTGLLVIAVVITSYFIVTILAETAQSGTPFGKRFNKTWAPLRIIIAFGLLMPLTVGLNSSQYIVLYAAKYGSAFASNGWRMFNTTLTTTYLGSAQSLISLPNVPDLGYLTQFMYVARTCGAIQDYYSELDWYNSQVGLGPVPPMPADMYVEMYALWKRQSQAANTLVVQEVTSYDALLAGMDSEYTSVTFIFGIKNDKYGEYRNNVKPVCGEVNMVFTDPRKTIGPAELIVEQGPYLIQEGFFEILRGLWHAGTMLAFSYTNETAFAAHRHVEIATRLTNGMPPQAAHSIALNAKYVEGINNQVIEILGDAVADGVTAARLSGRIVTAVTAEPYLYSKGWAAAGLWYNRVAEMNGAIMSATYAIPTVVKHPDVQEQVMAIKAKYDKEVDTLTNRKPEAAAVKDISRLLKGANGLEFAKTLYQAEFEWGSGGVSKQQLKGNAFLDAMSSVLGLDGLYDMRRNPDAHPLAMLVGIGRSLVESAVKSLGYAAMASLFAASGVAGSLGTISASFFVSIAMMGLTVGFVLFYVVPFLPFIYFFFAVGGWIKGIFEAMVGAPLWALAHIRIDGHGLSGNAAINGYFLIFEVFLRPILIVFGLLASISIFSALVSVLNPLFSVVTANVGGFDKAAELDASIVIKNFQFARSKIDEFFFTVIYAMIVYLIGMSSFKLIDTIPNNILRWMGQSVATFGDQAENPAEALVSKASIGSQQSLSKIGSGLQGAVQGADKIGGK